MIKGTQTSDLLSADLMVIQQNMSHVNGGYESLGKTLRSRESELRASVSEFRAAKSETDDMMAWLREMKKTAATWNSVPSEKDSVKTQLEQQKVEKKFLLALIRKTLSSKIIC